MILYQLCCDNGHGFEGWFRDSAAFDDQAARGLLSCALCGSAKVEKAIMAPRLGKGKPEAEVIPPAKAVAHQAELLARLRALRAEIEANCEHVGDRFADEARKIHYGESDPRGIYGEASAQEAEALREEGIGIARIPWVPRADT